MKNLIMALMMLLVLGAGFLLGSKYNLNDGQLNILESTNGTSDNLDAPRYVREDLNKSKGQYKVVNNQKSDFKEVSEPEVQNSTLTGNSDEVLNNESDMDLNDSNGPEEGNQSENQT